MFITLSTLSLGVATFENNKLSFSQDTIYAAVKNGYENGIYYQNSQKANGYLNDGTHWYLFKDGVKHQVFKSGRELIITSIQTRICGRIMLLENNGATPIILAAMVPF